MAARWTAPCGQVERVAVPVEAGHLAVGQPAVLGPEDPVPTAGGSEYDLSRADLGGGPTANLGAEGGGQLLGAEAHGQHG